MFSWLGETIWGKSERQKEREHEERMERERERREDKNRKEMEEKERKKRQEEREHELRMEREREKMEEKKRKEMEEKEREERESLELMWNPGLEIEWTEKNRNKLQASILSQPKDSEGNEMTLRILLFGPTGHGKSSLCNGFRSALLGTPNVTHFHPVGVASGSSFSTGICGSLSGENNYLCITDMSGIYESEMFKDEDVKDLLSGKVPFYAKVTEHLQVLNREDMIIPEPGTNDVSCVVVVSKPDTEFGPETKRLLNLVESLAKEALVSRCLVLTHIDQIDSTFVDPRNLPRFLQSKNIKKAVKTMSERTGIPRSAINVVRNYSIEGFTNLNANILLLHTLSSIVFEACETHEREIEQKKIKAYYKGSTTTAAKVSDK